MAIKQHILTFKKIFVLVQIIMELTNNSTLGQNQQTAAHHLELGYCTPAP